MLSGVRLRASNLAHACRGVVLRMKYSRLKDIATRSALGRALPVEIVSSFARRPGRESGTRWHCDGRAFEFFRKAVQAQLMRRGSDILIRIDHFSPPC